MIDYEPIPYILVIMIHVILLLLLLMLRDEFIRLNYECLSLDRLIFVE